MITGAVANPEFSVWLYGSLEGSIHREGSEYLLPPANEVCEGYVFTPVCQSFVHRGGVHGRGVRMVGGMNGGGCMAGGGMHGRGVCMVGVCVWQGVCMAGGHVWQGGVHGKGGMVGGMCGRGRAWQGAVHSGGGGCACHACPPTLWDMVGQCVGGTHPTGMHFYFEYFSGQKKPMKMTLLNPPQNVTPS